jgi:tetratricopeptide (TPR) repeat protein
MFLSYIFNDSEGTKESATKYFDAATKPPWTLLIIHSAHAFFGSLISYRLLRETGNPIWAARAKKFHSNIKLWAEQGSSWNWEHKLQLLDAEEHHSNGNLDSAIESYKNAIAGASKHRFVHGNALSCERAADFYLGIGELATAMDHYTQAFIKYETWGALAKAGMLKRTFLGVNTHS